MDTGRFPVISRGDVRAAVLYMAVVVVLYLSGVANQPLLSGVFEATPWPPVVSLVLMLTGALCTLFRSSRPELLLVVVVPVSLLELLGGHQVSAYVLLVEGLWAPVARGNARSAGSATVAGVVVGAVMGVTMVVSWGDTVALGTAVVVGAMIIVVTVFTPLAWGWEVRHHKVAQEAAEELARTEHELAGERAAREVESDRLRIAQDLHDVVAGHLTAVSLHTSLALDLDEPAARARSLETARDSAEAALGDLRDVIGVLAGPGPTAGRQAASMGPTLNWEIFRQRLGEEAVVETDPQVDDPAIVATSVRSVLLHICSEAVTNAVRHGTSPRSLRVVVHSGRVELDCRNRCLSPAQTGPAQSTTLGLRTMDNRARALGGEVVAGTCGERPDTWMVQARLPLHTTGHGVP
ncbi:sensor histidine kinase [Corynebacterium sp.]|uniref:sensor histidine kinase n=1 Tax=Corynebacterium sp. TaxID=1720 RepID=UPI003B3A4909